MVHLTPNGMNPIQWTDSQPLQTKRKSVFDEVETDDVSSETVAQEAEIIEETPLLQKQNWTQKYDSVALYVLEVAGDSLAIYHLEINSDRSVRVTVEIQQLKDCDKTLRIWKSQAKWMLALGCVSGSTGIIGSFSPLADLLKNGAGKSSLQTVCNIFKAFSGFSDHGVRIVETSKGADRYRSQEYFENIQKRRYDDGTRDINDHNAAYKSLESFAHDFLRADKETKQRMAAPAA